MVIAGAALSIVVLLGFLYVRDLRLSSSAVRIAVLVFDNFSRDAGNDYLGDGLSEELLDGLAQMAGLSVVSRTASFYYKDKGMPARVRICRLPRSFERSKWMPFSKAACCFARTWTMSVSSTISTSMPAATRASPASDSTARISVLVFETEIQGGVIPAIERWLWSIQWT